MTKAKIKVIFRSPTPEEIELGVREYTYSILSNIPADIRSKTFSFNDGQTVNTQLTTSTTFSLILANDKTDRINRIVYVEYLGILYEVSNVIPYPPRINVTIGQPAKIKITELRMEKQDV